MKKFFQYTQSDEAFNSLVDNNLDLARQAFSGKKAADYADKNRELLEAMGARMAEGTRFEAKFESEGLAMFKNPTVNRNSDIRENFNLVIAQVINAIVPEVVNESFEAYLAEIKQVGYGDTAVFQIESNDLFKVNQKAEGVRKGVDQPMFDDEITVVASPLTVDASIDWYPFAAGVFDMGNFALKIARSYEAHIFTRVVKGMLSAANTVGSAYTANGVTPQLWGTLRQRVSAANGGMNVVAIGTEVALSSVSLGGNFQVAIGEEMNKIGYLDQYLNTPLIALKNVLVPGTVNGAATLALADNKIYMIPVGGTKPVKILFEGSEMSVSFNPDETSDRRYGITIELRVGIEAVCGSKYGTITL